MALAFGLHSLGPGGGSPIFSGGVTSAYLHTTGAQPSLSGAGDAWIGARATNNIALWLGVTPSGSNYALSSSPSGDTTINATTGQTVTFAVNNSVLGTIGSGGMNSTNGFSSPGFTVSSGTITCGQINAGGLIVSQSGAILKLDGQIADGAGAVPVQIGPFVTYANTTAHLVDFVNGNGGSTKSFIDMAGVYTANAGGGLALASKAMLNTAPTISSGFGTSPSIVASNGSLAFQINVGTGGVATSGVIGLPTAANGWVVTCTDITTPSVVTQQTASTTTTATIGGFTAAAGAATAWTASDKINCIAVAY